VVEVMVESEKAGCNGKVMKLVFRDLDQNENDAGGGLIQQYG
jgi:hypothetical protein